MASYKYAENVVKNNSEAFDKEFKPGEKATWHGIYKCINCGDEIAIAAGHTLPSQNHYQHKTSKPVIWRLAVYSVQKKD